MDGGDWKHSSAGTKDWCNEGDMSSVRQGLKGAG